MPIEKFMKTSGKISEILAYLGCFVLIVMMLLTMADVVGRYIFNTPILGVFEITEFLVLLLIFSFLGFTQQWKTHISVDLVFNNFPPKMRYFVDALNHLICLVLMILITWRGIVKALDMKEVGQQSPNLLIPEYPFVFFLAFGCAVFCLEYIRDLVKLFKSKE
ncbi:MAG: TRAP transporter small permease [Desulfobacteraceae bacterium]|nr:TRAP transporter small permease [Desulfobacteraceae bacterium]